MGRAPLGVSLRDEHGLALVATLLAVVLIGVLIAGAVTGSLVTTRTASADYEASRAFYAAEAGGEVALAALEVAVLDGVLDDDELSNISPPTLAGYTFTQFDVVKEGAVIQQTITDGPFSGLMSFTQNLIITSQVTHESGAQSTVVLASKAQAIPIFQFGFFHAGHWREGSASRKDWWGRVHANGGIYVSVSDGHFHDYVTTPGKIYRDDFEGHMPVEGNASKPAGIHVFIDNPAADEKELSFDSADTPDPDAFKAKSEADYGGRLRTDAYGVDSLELPLPTDIAPRELIRPRDADDTDSEKAIKYAWQADMYVTVDLGIHQTKNDACANNPPSGAPSLLPKITVIRPNGGSVPDDDDKCRIFFWTWTTFYDNDEEGWVDVLDVDMGQLRSWVNGPGDAVSMIYVEIIQASVQNASTTDDDSSPSGQFNNAYFPVLRIVNGSQLPGPLTVGSEYPLIVQGDYNTTSWQPSSLFGDRLTSLSSSWDDANAQTNYDNDCRYATSASALCPDATLDTDQWFAFVVGQGKGFVGCFHEDPGCDPSMQPPNGTSGSVRLLEDWKNGSCPGGRCTLTLRGSFIYLWRPEIANWEWESPSSNATYRRPNRDWGFDSRFLDPLNLPPGTPSVGQIWRAAFREAF